jgi:hypothetical protein
MHYCNFIIPFGNMLCNFIIPFGNMLFPLLTAEWLHPVLYFSTEYYNSRLIILIWKYLLDIRSEAWLNLFWEYINGKLFAVLYWRIDGGKEAPCCVDWCIHPIQSNPLPIHSSPLPIPIIYMESKYPCLITVNPRWRL